jgi:hypothetical protein
MVVKTAEYTIDLERTALDEDRRASTTSNSGRPTTENNRRRVQHKWSIDDYHSCLKTEW